MGNKVYRWKDGERAVKVTGQGREKVIAAWDLSSGINSVARAILHDATNYITAMNHGTAFGSFLAGKWPREVTTYEIDCWMAVRRTALREAHREREVAVDA